MTEVLDVHHTFPRVWVGDWVMRRESSTFYGGRVRAIWQDEFNPGQYCIDLSVFNADGKRVGRSSTSMGGTTTFEPDLSLVGFERIAKPDFPVATGHHYCARNRYRDQLTFLPDRETLRPNSKASPADLRRVINRREALDASALRLAAERIREVAGKIPAKHRDLLLQESAALERLAHERSIPMVA